MPGSFHFNFLGLEEAAYTELEGASVVILPVPYEGTVSYKSGTRFGPKAIIEASSYVELYDMEYHIEAYKNIGIFTAAPVIPNTDSVRSMQQAIREIYYKYLKENKFVVMLGGEHSITLAAVKAHLDLGEDFGVLYLDAHGDLRNEYEGSIYNHACVMRRISEHVPIVGVGIRSICQEEAAYIKKEEISVFTPQNIRETSDWITEVLNVLPEKVYISLDVDVFDPSFMPATGTPEPEGLSYYEVRELLKEVTREKKVIGLDVVELSPCENLHHCEFSMAKLIYQFLTYKYVFNT